MYMYNTIRGGWIEFLGRRLLQARQKSPKKKKKKKGKGPGFFGDYLRYVLYT